MRTDRRRSIVHDELTTVEPAMIARLTPRNDRSGRFAGRGRWGAWKGEAAMPFADQDLARRVEEAWVRLGVENAQAQARLDPESGAMALPVGGGYAVFMGVGSPLSQVQGVGLYGPLSEAEVERMETFYRERGRPIQLELASLADSSLLGLLSRRGYRAVEQTHVLVRPLGSREPAGEQPSPARRAGPAMRRRRSRSCRSGRTRWRPGPSRCSDASSTGRRSCPARSWKARSRWPPSPMVSCWLARRRPHRRGRALVIHNRLALICGDGTLPEFRSQGVQTALLRARLDRARRPAATWPSSAPSPAAARSATPNARGSRSFMHGRS